MELYPLVIAALLSHVTPTVANTITVGDHVTEAALRALRDLQAMRHNHHVSPRAVGSCETDQLPDIFEDITERCGEALITVTSVSTLRSPAGLSALNTICRRSCGRILTTFADTCDFPALGVIFRTICAQNEDGLCLLASVGNNGSHILASCGPSPPVECSAECRGAVEEFRSHLGCCVQTHFNSSVFGLDLLPLASHQLWTACAMETIRPCADPFGTGRMVTASSWIVGALLTTSLTVS